MSVPRTITKTMKVTRRSLLSGTAAVMASAKAHAWPRHGKAVPSETQFIQGALGAGGYAMGFSPSADGNYIGLRNDTENGYIWSRSTNKWRNTDVSPGMGVDFSGSSTCYEIAFAPTNSNRVYKIQVLGQPENYYNNGNGTTYCYLWRSNDAGNTWTVNSTTPLAGQGGSLGKFGGPHMAVDPNNADVVYIISLSGICYVTYDGGVTLSVITGLLAALPTATATADTLAGNNTVTVGSCPIAGLTEYCAYNSTHPLSVGSSGNTDQVFFADATSFVPFVISPQDKATSGYVAGVSTGDVFYFGTGCSVCIDPSATTKANPGGSGVISNIVYFIWRKGATDVWRTTNGGTSWAAIGVAGGPTGTETKCRISFDGVLYVSDGFVNGDSFYRWVGASPPSGSGLTANTWTRIVSGVTGAIVVVEPHPTIAGKCVAMNKSTGTGFSTNWGTSFSLTPGIFEQTSGPPGLAPNGTDVPWMSQPNGPNRCQDYQGDDGIYDRTVADRFWVTTGIGVGYVHLSTTATASITGITKGSSTQVTVGANDWVIGDLISFSSVGGMTEINGLSGYITNIAGSVLTVAIDSTTFTNYTSGGTATFIRVLTSLSNGMDSMTVTTINKILGGRILVGCEDRPFFSLANPTTFPTIYGPVSTVGINHATDMKPSDSDNTVVWGATSVVYRSTDSGQTWASAAFGGGTFQANITNITKAASAVITISGPPSWAIGECFYIYGVGGMTEINHLLATITNVAGSNFTVDINSSGFTAYSGGGLASRGLYPMLASTGPTSCVMVPETDSPDAALGPICYTNNSGSTWLPSLFGGSKLIGRGGGPFANCRHYMASDGFGNYYYYDTTTGKVWKSTDGGANFTEQGTVVGPVIANGGAVLMCTPGVAGHLWLTQGLAAGFTVPGPMFRSTDSGVNWSQVAQANDKATVCTIGFGKAAPGQSYPAMYLYGGGCPPTVANFGLWRCDNPDSAARTYVKLSNITKVDNSGAFGGVCGDMGVYGDVYFGTGSSGYLYGRLV